MGWNEIITSPITFYTMMVLLVLFIIILLVFGYWVSFRCQPATGISGMAGQYYYCV
jgi:hypothetical protein